MMQFHVLNLNLFLCAFKLKKWDILCVLIHCRLNLASLVKENVKFLYIGLTHFLYWDMNFYMDVKLLYMNIQMFLCNIYL